MFNSLIALKKNQKKIKKKKSKKKKSKKSKKSKKNRGKKDLIMGRLSFHKSGLKLKIIEAYLF